MSKLMPQGEGVDVRHIAMHLAYNQIESIAKVALGFNDDAKTLAYRVELLECVAAYLRDMAQTDRAELSHAKVLHLPQT